MQEFMQILSFTVTLSYFFWSESNERQLDFLYSQWSCLHYILLIPSGSGRSCDWIKKILGHVYSSGEVDKPAWNLYWWIYYMKKECGLKEMSAIWNLHGRPWLVDHSLKVWSRSERSLECYIPSKLPSVQTRNLVVPQVKVRLNAVFGEIYM